MKKKTTWWQAEELLEEIELQESELGILGKCIDTEKFLPYIFFAAFPFLSLLCCIFLCKTLNHILPVGENHGCFILKGAESPVLL